METASLGPPLHVYHQKTRLSWKDVQEGCDYLIFRLDIVSVQSIYTIPRGGLVVASILAYGLGIQKVYTWPPPLPLRKSCLVVDDICDTSNTLRGLRLEFPRSPIVTLARRANSPEWPDLWAFTFKHKEYVKFPWEKK